MSARFKFFKKINETLREDIYNKRNEAEKNRIAEFYAEKSAEAEDKIRGRVEAAVIIQKNWRGILGRRYYKECLLKYFRPISMKHYNSMATKIQKVWRGYWIRKYVFNYYTRKEYFKSLLETNEDVLTQLKILQDERKKIEFEKAQQFEKQHHLELCSKYHHLISTKAIPGIYNSPYGSGDARDQFLKSVNFIRDPAFKESKKISVNNRYEKVLDAIKNRPAAQPKYQGPFKDPKEVQLHRYKTRPQTLRMETDFYHLEKARKEMKNKEWTERIHDDIFLCTPTTNKDSEYQMKMHSMSNYVPFEHQFNFRKEDASLNTDKNDFKLVLPPIALFDEFQEKAEEQKHKETLQKN